MREQNILLKEQNYFVAGTLLFISVFDNGYNGLEGIADKNDLVTIKEKPSLTLIYRIIMR